VSTQPIRDGASHTARTLQAWLREVNNKNHAVVFPNAHGRVLSRNGVDYLLRRRCTGPPRRVQAFGRRRSFRTLFGTRQRCSSYRLELISPCLPWVEAFPTDNVRVYFVFTLLLPNQTVNDQTQVREDVKIVLTGGSGDLGTVLMPKLEAWEHAGPVGFCAAARPLRKVAWRAPCLSALGSRHG
jgi:hypothetical protein